jgi:flagellar motility protein MotE (MotC chaperone)
MSRIPRILPLVAVAVSGVLAVKALDTFGAAPEFLKTASAWAEDAPKPAGKAAAPAAKAAALPQAKPNAVCAPTAAELAKEAGLSPAELRLLQSLGTRRGELDQREKSMETQIALLAAAESKLDKKLKALEALKAEMKGMVGQAAEKEKAEIGRLVRVYENMKPKDAAAVMAQLDDRVRLPVAGAMKERSLAAILAQMPPVEAKRLTEKLAARFTADAMQTKLAEATANPPAAEPVAAQAAASPPAKAAAPQRRAENRPPARRPAPARPRTPAAKSPTNAPPAKAAPAPVETAAVSTAAAPQAASAPAAQTPAATK